MRSLLLNWFAADGREQFFDLRRDPKEEQNRIDAPGCAERVAEWRNALIDTLQDRPEGFVSNENLVPGRPYRGLMPGTAST